MSRFSGSRGTRKESPRGARGSGPESSSEPVVGTVLVSYQREVLVQPGTLSEPRLREKPVAAELPRALYRGRGRIVAGDEVQLETRGRGGRLVVADLLPRRSEFFRTAVDGRSQLLFSNLELLVICASPSEPQFRPGLIDRILVAAEIQELEPVVLLNKTDLTNPEGAEEMLAPYRHLEIECLVASARTGEGIEALARLLQGRCSALVGHSGVGKSSLVNCLIPGADLVVGEITAWSGKGQHTTTRSRLLPLPQGGFLLDSPGIRTFGLLPLEPRELARLFPDFQDLPPCRFTNCLHLTESECAVRAALEAKELAPERYLSYQRIQKDLGAPMPEGAEFGDDVEVPEGELPQAFDEDGDEDSLD